MFEHFTGLCIYAEVGKQKNAHLLIFILTAPQSGTNPDDSSFILNKQNILYGKNSFNGLKGVGGRVP